MPEIYCDHCTRPIEQPTEGEYAGRWVHSDSGLPQCLLRRGEA